MQPWAAFLSVPNPTCSSCLEPGRQSCWICTLLSAKLCALQKTWHRVGSQEIFTEWPTEWISADTWWSISINIRISENFSFSGSILEQAVTTINFPSLLNPLNQTFVHATLLTWIFSISPVTSTWLKLMISCQSVSHLILFGSFGHRAFTPPETLLPWFLGHSSYLSGYPCSLFTPPSIFKKSLLLIF